MSEEVKGSSPENMLLSLRMYLILKAMESGCDFFVAAEAVSSTMLSWQSPDPSLRTYLDWEDRYNKGKNK